MTGENTYNMPDESDRATAIEHAITDASISDIRHAANKRDQEPDSSGVYRILDCVECDNPIGEGRLRAAIRNTLCVHCASALEALRRRYA